MSDAQEALDTIKREHKYHAQFLENIAKSLSDYASLVETLPDRGLFGSGDGGCRRDMAKALAGRADDLRRHAAFARAHFIGED